MIDDIDAQVAEYQDRRAAEILEDRRTNEFRDTLPGEVAMCAAAPDEEEIGRGELYARLLDGTLWCAQHYIERLEAQYADDMAKVEAAQQKARATRSLIQMAEREVDEHPS
jgi:hypothetical protein